MKTVRLWLALALFLALPGGSFAQTVLQSGLPVPGHAAKFYSNQVVGDSGTALAGPAGNGLSELGITNATNCGLGISDANIEAGGWHTLCIGTNPITGGIIDYEPYGNAAPLPLRIRANGVDLTFGGGVGTLAGDVIGPVGSNLVTGLRGRPLSTASPGTGQALCWDGSQWTPGSCAAPSTGIPVAATNAALMATATSVGPAIIRLDYSTFGAGPQTFTPSNSACTFPDGGVQVPSSDGKCWIANPKGVFDVLQFGAGTGTNDTPAITAAFAACSRAGGGQVNFRPIGHSYPMTTGITVAALGCIAHGDTHGFWKTSNPVFDNVEADYTTNGVWVRCDDLSNSCFNITGDGSGIEGINFWHTQDTPPSGSQCSVPCTFTHNWAPRNYPYAITVGPTANHVRLRDISMVNATNCIDLEGPNSGVFGVGTSLEHLNLGCARTGIKFRLIDNTLNLTDIHHELWWYQGASDWWGWMESGNSHVDWDMCYLANPMISNVEFAFSQVAMKFTDCTVSSGFGNITFGAFLQGTNISFNENCQAMTVAGPATHVNGNLLNVLAYSDSTSSPVAGQCANQTGATNPANYFFQLNTDNVDLYMESLSGGLVQGLVLAGGGAVGAVHGQVHISNLVQFNYSAYQSNTPLLLTDTTGSIVDVADLNYAFHSGAFTAGAKCSGACASKVPYTDIAANLPTCGTTTIGAQIYIADLAVAPTYNTIITTGSGGGGGANRRIATCDGAAWRL